MKNKETQKRSNETKHILPAILTPNNNPTNQILANEEHYIHGKDKSKSVTPIRAYNAMMMYKSLLSCDTMYNNIVDRQGVNSTS